MPSNTTNAVNAHFNRARATAHRLQVKLQAEIRHMEITKKQQIHCVDSEIRTLRESFSRIQTCSGHYYPQTPPTKKEEKELRIKLRKNPSLVFGQYDDIMDLSAKLSRNRYRRNFNIDYVITKGQAKKKLHWPD